MNEILNFLKVQTFATPVNLLCGLFDKYIDTHMVIDFIEYHRFVKNEYGLVELTERGKRFLRNPE